MSLNLPLSAAAPQLEVDTPSWAPILFAAGAFAVIALVLILMWKKLRQSDSWGQSGPQNPGTDHPHDDGDPRDDSPRR